MRKLNQVLLTLLLCFAWAIAQAQPSVGGTPPSFKSKSEGMILKSTLRKSTLTKPEKKKLYEEDFAAQLNGSVTPPRVAVVLPVNYTPENSGEWIKLESGDLIWQLTINVPDAIALSLTYSNFKLPTGSKLFIYSANKKQIIGAYTSANNPVGYKEFATELVAGDELTLEYVAPATEAIKVAGATEAGTGQPAYTSSYTPASPIISISGIAYAYNEAFIHISREFYDTDLRTMSAPGDNNASGPCMVNINCSEGANWQDEKRGIAATLQKIGTGYYICTGTLVNNTSRNTDPLFLMAFHCSNTGTVAATDADINQWVFYFHWESVACERNSPIAAYKTMTGATRLVSIPLNAGSDGLLLRLKNPIPTDWHVYYNGWDRRNTPATSGVGIHHPAGDVKKISTFTDPATSVGGQAFTNYGNTALNSGWYVKYVATQNGHGVVQGGSSGSPLFDQNKRVIGTLSGGSSSCNNPLGTNIYGKLWYHWDQMADQTLWMKPFLDPDNTGEEVIEGLYVQGKVTPEFSMEKDTVWAAEPVSFINISSGATTSNWEFPGGTPSSYSGKTPPPISYNTPGSYSVKLTINKGTADEKFIEKANCVVVILKEIAVKEIKTGDFVAALPLGANTGYGKLYTAALYHKEELDWVNGDLTKLDWKCNNALTAASNTRSVKIYLKHVPASVENLYDDATYKNYINVSANAKLVASYSSFVNTTGYQEFPFNVGNNKFTYDKDSSLLVISEVEYASNGSRQPNCYVSTVNAHARTWQVSSSASVTASTSGTRGNSRPNIRLTNKMTVSAPVADFQISNAGEYLLFEGFDNKSIPTTWSIEKPGVSMNQWRLVTILDESTDVTPFNKVEPGPSRQSLRVMYDEKKEVDTWLKSPEVTISDPATVIDFSIHYVGPSLSGGYTNLYISVDGGTWTQKWTTGTTNDASRPAAWRKQRIPLTEYVGKTIRFAWQYKGTYGENTYLDGIKVFIPGNKITTFEGESVYFMDHSEGTPVVWKWALPGSTMPNSPVQNIYATYMQAGSYTPSLQITNNLGSNTKSVENGVAIKARIPNTQFYSKSKNRYTTYPQQGQFLPLSGGTIQLQDTTLYYPKSFEWALPGANPTTSTDAAIIANYPAGMNSYSVTFKATNSAGTKDLTIPDYVKVGGTADIWNIPYGDPGKWVISGNNSAGKQLYYTGSSPDWSEVAEYFKGSAPGELSKISLFITKYNTVNLTLNVYSDNKGKPGTKITSVPLPNASIVDGNYTTITLPTPVGVDSSFFISVSGFPPYSTASTASRAAIASSKETQGASNCTAYVFLDTDGQWAPTTSLTSSSNISLSMNIVATLRQTTAQLTSASTFERKDVDASTGTISFTTNGASWWATADPWITLSSPDGVITGGAGSLTFTCQDNTKPQMRTGKITVYPGGVPHTITVTQGGSYPANFKASYDDNAQKVKLIWGDGQIDPITTDVFDGAEDHGDFEINSRMPNYWSYIDVDGKPTYMASNATYPGATDPKAFMIFNPSATTPAISASIYAPHSGSKYFACFASNGAANNDWMISPLVTYGSSFTFSFWAKSLTADYGKERFNVYYSTTSKEKVDFTNKVTTGDYTEAPTVWTKYTYSIPAEARYIAINCISNDAFIFMVDDIFIGTGSAPTQSAPVMHANAEAESTQAFTGKTADNGVSAVQSVSKQAASAATKYKLFKDGNLLVDDLIDTYYYDANTTIGTTPCYKIVATYEGNPFFESVKSPDQCAFVKSPITITADNMQMIENDAIPTFTATFAGQLFDTDTYADVADVAYSCEANTASLAGTYTIVTTSTTKLSDKYVVTTANSILTVNPYPSVITQQPEGGIVCKNDSYTLSALGSGLEIRYQWQKQHYGSWQNVNGANDANYTITNARPDDAGNYRVLVNGRTAVATSNIISVEVALPKEDILTFEWDDVPTVNCNPATNGGHVFVSFQWYKNGVLIPGATKPYILADDNATYDCKMTSNQEQSFRLCGYAHQASNAQLTVYPNPASPSDQVIVKQSNTDKGAVINIYNVNGGLVKGGIPVNNPETSVRINEFTPGMYILQVAEPKGTKQTTKLLVK